MSFPRKGTRLCFVLECYNLLPASARMVRTEIVRRGMTWASMKQARRGPAASSSSACVSGAANAARCKRAGPTAFAGSSPAACTTYTAQGGPAWTRGLRAAIGENSRPAPSSYTARPSLALTLLLPDPPSRWRLTLRPAGDGRASLLDHRMSRQTYWAATDTVLVIDWGERRELKFPGSRVDRRGDVFSRGDALHLNRGGKFYEKLRALPALVSIGWNGERNDWVDRKALRGLLALRPRSARCFVCNGYLSARCNTDLGGWIEPKARWSVMLDPMQLLDGGHPCHDECFHLRWEEDCRVRAAVKPLRKLERQAKALAKIAQVLDVPMTFEEAAKLLPWRPHKSALLRMAIKGRLQSTTVNGDRRLRGRDLLPLVQNWVSTGRAPWRNSKKAREQQAKEVR